MLFRGRYTVTGLYATIYFPCILDNEDGTTQIHPKHAICSNLTVMMKLAMDIDK
jgi:hypothetical protein